VFDGVDDYVRGAIPSSLSGNHPYTFSLWIKPDAIQSNYIAVFEMGNNTAANQSCGLYLNGGTIVHVAYANNLTTSTSVVPNQWIHIIGTYTSGSRKVYADGVLLVTDTYSSLDIGATEMTLGANNDNQQLFDGSISNFKIWGGVALTAEEVAMEYALGRTGDVNDYNEVLAFDNIQYDNTGSYSTGTSNYKFTAPISGFYSFHFHCLFTRSSTSSIRLDLKYYKNGGLINHLEMNGDFDTSSALNVGRGHTCHVHLSAGDYIQAVFAGVGDMWTVYTAGGYDKFDVFSGHLVFADV
jgi:hypothetical protein